MNKPVSTSKIILTSMAVIVSNPQFNSFYLDSNRLKMVELLAKILTMTVP
jgi:hypothetical protein